MALYVTSSRKFASWSFFDITSYDRILRNRGPNRKFQFHVFTRFIHAAGDLFAQARTGDSLVLSIFSFGLIHFIVDDLLEVFLPVYI